MTSFLIFPAIDLRGGQVVRLSQGDPDRQKTYSNNPAEIARSMFQQGSTWLHVVNLDGAFGESSSKNLQALAEIIKTAKDFDASIQFGGGLHSFQEAELALENGVSRVILGSAAIKDPEIVRELLKKNNPDQIGVSLDSLDKRVMVSGWQEESGVGVMEMVSIFRSMGLKWLVYTDISRDGMQSGSDKDTTVEISKTGINVIASGGVSSLDEVISLKENGVAGAIVGRALYEGTLSLQDLLSISKEK